MTDWWIMLANKPMTRSISTTLRRAASGVASVAVELLFPARCMGCNREGAFLCDACQETLPVLKPPFCFLCSEPSSLVMGLCRNCRAEPLQMEGAVRAGIHALKYQGVRAMAPTLGQLLAQFLTQEALDADLLVPVPLHTKRERKRGYNQSLLLAQATGKALDWPVEPHALLRLKDTPSQLTLRAEERRANVEGAFQAQRNVVAGKGILVIDDVCTTGATLEACAMALKEAGAASVWGVGDKTPLILRQA